MILPVNERYRLAANSYCWMIQRRRKRKDPTTGKQVGAWSPILWFVTLEEAINGLSELMIRTSDAKTLADTLAEMEKITATLSQAQAPKLKVTLAEPLLDQENLKANLSQADAQEKEAAG